MSSPPRLTAGKPGTSYGLWESLWLLSAHARISSFQQLTAPSCLCSVFHRTRRPGCFLLLTDCSADSRGRHYKENFQSDIKRQG